MKKVVPLSNEPEELYKYAVKLGLEPEGSHFAEVFSLDEDMAAFVPRPAYSLIFLFPIGPKDGVLETRHKGSEDVPSPTPWFTKQLISNSCGTIAVIHSVVNMVLQGRLKVKDGSWFANFIQKTKDMSPDERGKCIYDDDTLFAVHQAASQASDVPIPDTVDTHFVAFLMLGENLWELDGRKAHPICHGKVEDLILGTLAVIKKEFMPHIEDHLRISMCALTAPPQE